MCKGTHAALYQDLCTQAAFQAYSTRDSQLLQDDIIGSFSVSCVSLDKYAKRTQKRTARLVGGRGAKLLGANLALRVAGLAADGRCAAAVACAAAARQSRRRAVVVANIVLLCCVRLQCGRRARNHAFDVYMQSDRPDGPDNAKAVIEVAYCYMVLLQPQLAVHVQEN